MPPRVVSYMSSPVITAYENDNLAHIRHLMIRHKIGKVVIKNPSTDEVSGIISKSDFITILYNRRKYVKPLTNIFAYEIMTQRAYAVEANRSIKHVANLMYKKRIGSLIVLDNKGKLVGIITKADLVRAYAERYQGRFRVSDFMLTDFPRVHLTHTLHYVVDLMRETGIGKAVVTDNDRPVGVITKSDVIFLDIESLLRRPVKYYKRAGLTGRRHAGVVRIYMLPLAMDIMTPDPLTVRYNEDLAIAADVMVKNRIGTLPVVDESDNLVGLITKRDIIKALRRV